MIEGIKGYLKENFFRPAFVDNKPLKERDHYLNIFREKGRMSSEYRTQFFDEAYGEILFDLFIRWCQTELEEKDLRESLYQNALALGSVKSKLISYENYAANVPYIEESRSKINEEEEDDDDG